MRIVWLKNALLYPIDMAATAFERVRHDFACAEGARRFCETCARASGASVHTAGLVA